MYQLDMSSVTKSASGSGLAWEAVNNPSFDASSYQTTMAQAANHISESPPVWRGHELMVDFFGVPGTAAGSADVFVIHCMSFSLPEDTS